MILSRGAEMLAEVAAESSTDYVPLPMARPLHLLLPVASLLLPIVAWLGGCNLDNSGDRPPRGLVYFPTGVTLGADQELLYVVNSNFDRRYSSGSLQAYDLDALASAVEDCGDQGASCEIDPTSVLADEVLVDSLARALALSSDGTRLWIASHARGALTYVEAEGAGLACGGGRSCDDAHVRGRSSSESPRGLTLPLDPVAVHSVSLAMLPGGDSLDVEGEAILVLHRRGEVSLMLDQGEGPVLVDVLETLTPNLTGVTFDPGAGLFYLTNQRSTTSTESQYLQRVGVSLTVPVEDSYLFEAAPLTLRGISQGQNTWAVAAGAGEDPTLVLTQTPDALLHVRMETDGLNARVERIVEVGAGASRLVLGTLSGEGTERTLAVVNCYTERMLYIVDAQSGDVLGIVPGLSGPAEVAFDSERGFVYVADFRSSSVRIVDVKPILARDQPRVAATLGFPQFLEELN